MESKTGKRREYGRFLPSRKDYRENTDLYQSTFQVMRLTFNLDTLPKIQTVVITLVIY